MHAVIKIVCFLIFTAAVSVGEPAVLLLGLLMIVPLYLFNISERGRAHLGTAMAMLKRLRWLFLSIFIVYLFFTPGMLVWPGVLWGPTEEGVMLGLSRIAVLVLIVAAVNVLLTSTEQAEFLAAVHWCLQPLSWFGLPHERLAVRIALTLESVSAVREAYRHESRAGSDGEKELTLIHMPVHKSESKILAISKTAYRLFSKVVADAEAAPLREIALPEQSRPPLLQWGIPLLLFATIVAAKLLAKTIDVDWV
jgi:hypothetical protein